MVCLNIRKAKKYDDYPNVSKFYYGKAKYYGNEKERDSI